MRLQVDRYPYLQTQDSGAIIADYHHLRTLEAAHSSDDPSQSQNCLLQIPTDSDSGLFGECSSQSISGDYECHSQSLAGDSDRPCCLTGSSSHGTAVSFHPDCYCCCFHSNQKRLGCLPQWRELKSQILVRPLEAAGLPVHQIPERVHHPIDYLRSYY